MSFICDRYSSTLLWFLLTIPFRACYHYANGQIFELIIRHSSLHFPSVASGTRCQMRLDRRIINSKICPFMYCLHYPSTRVSISSVRIGRFSITVKYHFCLGEQVFLLLPIRFWWFWCWSHCENYRCYNCNYRIQNAPPFKLQASFLKCRKRGFWVLMLCLLVFCIHHIIKQPFLFLSTVPWLVSSLFSTCILLTFTRLII